MVMVVRAECCTLTPSWKITVRVYCCSTELFISLLRPMAIRDLITDGFWPTTQQPYSRAAFSAQRRTEQHLAFGCRVPAWPRILLIQAACSWLPGMERLMRHLSTQ